MPSAVKSEIVLSLAEEFLSKVIFALPWSLNASTVAGGMVFTVLVPIS